MLVGHCGRALSVSERTSGITRSSVGSMPKYFFDLTDGDVTSSDEEGLKFPTLEAAEAEAQNTLADVALDALLTAVFPATEIAVRDQWGRVKIRMGLKLIIDRVTD